MEKRKEVFFSFPFFSFPVGMEATREIHLHVVISRSPAGRHPQLGSVVGRSRSKRENTRAGNSRAQFHIFERTGKGNIIYI